MLNRIITLVVLHIAFIATAFSSDVADKHSLTTVKNLQEFLAAEYMADNSVVVYFNYTQEEFEEYVLLNNVTEFVIKIYGRYTDNDDELLLATESLDPASGNVENWALVLTQGEMDNAGVPFDLLHGLIDINGIACTEGVDIIPEVYTEMPDLNCGEDIIEEIDDASPLSSIVAGETYTIKGFPFVAMDQNQGKLSIPFGNSVVLVDFVNVQVNAANQVVAGSLVAVADDGMNYRLDKYTKRKKNGDDDSDICQPPPPPSGYDENGINTETGLDDWGFDENGINQETGTTYDKYGFDKDGNHIDTGTPYNENGCSREGLDDQDNECGLSNGVNPDAENFLNENATLISNTINQIRGACTQELTDDLTSQTGACATLRTRMTEIVTTNSLPADLIFGEGNKYINPGMSAHFTSPPVALEGFNDRNEDVIELEGKHVELYHCDLKVIELEAALEGADNLPSDFEEQINEQITMWPEYQFELLSNDPELFEQWIKGQLESIASGEQDDDGGNFIQNNDDETKAVFTEEELKQKVSDIFAYKNNVFSVEQPVYISEKKSGENLNELLKQYKSGKKSIDGVDRVYYTEQIFDKKLKSGNSDMHNILPLRLTNEMSDKPYDIFIERIEIGLTGASLDAVIKIEDTKNGGHIIFRGENIGFGTGGLSGGDASYLRLDSEVGIRLSNAAKLHLLPTDTYVSWDCNGFKAIGVGAEIEFCPDFIKPVVNGVVDETENYRLAVQASEVSNWNDFHFMISAPPFVLTKYETIIWELETLVVDFSTSITEPNGTLPGYESLFSDGAGNLTNEWEGFYIQNLRAIMPKNFGDVAGNSSETFEVAVDLAIIDESGFTGQGSVTTELVSIDDGNLNGWAFSIDKFSLRVVNNEFAGTGFGGGIQLPIMEDTLGYTAEIYPGDMYKFSVGSIESSTSLLFNATLNLTNSSVTVEKNEDGFKASADLSGSLVFDQAMADDSDFSGINLPSVAFTNLQISNQAPHFKAGTWDLGDGGIGVGFGGFKIELDKIAPYEPEEEGTVGLGFDIAVIINDEVDISAKGSLGIVGELRDDGAGRQKWFYKRLELHALSVDAPIGSVAHIKGSVAFKKNDPEWGNYFQGALEVDLKKVAKTKITGIAQFGTKQDEKYFYVDVMVDLPVGIPVGPIEFTALGLGIYRNVTFSTEGLTITEMLNNNVDNIFDQLPKPGASLSTGVYTCATNVDFGIKGIAQFQTASEQMLNGTISLGAEFSGTTLDRLYLIGSAQFLATLDDNISTQFKTFDKVNTDAVLPSKPASVSVPMSAYIDFNMDFANSTFTGDIAAYLNTPLLYGAGTDGAVVVGKILFSPDDWHIKIGSPTNRAGVILKIPGIAEVKATAYFQVGTDTDPMAEIPDEIRRIAYSASRNESLLTTGQGLIFGAKLEIRGGIGVSGIAEAELTAIAGFDVMLRRYEGLSCQGESGDIGIKGWYASGQLYALLEGKLKIAGIKILEAGVAAILQAQLPNPFFAEATVAVSGKALFGLFEVNKSLTVTLGNQCVIQAETPAAVFGAEVIASITPGEEQQEVSVATQPEVQMNFPLNKVITMPSISGGESNFEVKLKSVKISSAGSGDIPNYTDLSEDGFTLSVFPIITLPQDEDVTITVIVNLFESNELLGEQEKVVTFHTGPALTSIPESNVRYAYPFKDMENYHPQQYSSNFIELFSGQPDLLLNQELKAFLSSNGAGEQEIDVSYDPGSRRINFNLPTELEADDYHFELVKIQDKGERSVLNSFNFSSSIYETFDDKIVAMQDYYDEDPFTEFSTVGEFFSDFEISDIISARFNISTSKENQFLGQFTDLVVCQVPEDIDEWPWVYEDWYTGTISVSNIKDRAKDLEAVVINPSYINVKYQRNYQTLYNNIASNIIESEEYYCNNGPEEECSEDCVKVPFTKIPSGDYDINIKYTIPGRSPSSYRLIYQAN